MLGFWIVLISGIIPINCVQIHEVFDIFLLSLIIYLLIDLLSRSCRDNINSIPFRPIICYWNTWLHSGVGVHSWWFSCIAQFVNITGGGSGDRIARLLSGSFNVDPKYQDRFTGGVTDSRASLTIRAVKSSDQGKYRFTLSPSGSGNISDDVEVIVQGNPNSFLWTK